MLLEACKVNLALSVYFIMGAIGRTAPPMGILLCPVRCSSFPTHTSFPPKQPHTLAYLKQVSVSPHTISLPLWHPAAVHHAGKLPDLVHVGFSFCFVLYIYDTMV